MNWEIFNIKLIPGNRHVFRTISKYNTSVVPRFTRGQIRLYSVTNLSTRNVPHCGKQGN